ncbi:DUF262 domain-containing protein [Peptoniphilus vaginalis]|uniref:DUF262 domain-containing protein n=1 Tax=Peptoniphilus vaginalis TaxID=1756987 RepID=UPI0023FA08DA|nr:DUF262 domain-containing protein [Peptoniphilus vaginalis]
MECRVCYGEYSLDHWLNLILKRNLFLPKYQRYFVWSEEKTNSLIKAFQEGQFVPPVTIGYFSNDDKNYNLILDGQQRLTSILLSYLGIFPDKETYKKTIEQYADENDNKEDEELFDEILEWSFKKLTEKGRNKNEILQKIKKGNYKEIETIDDEFLKTHYMGFSYLVPQTHDVQEQQRFYSTAFRNINIQGETLLPQESRESLYFLNENLANYFNPDFVKEIKVNDKKMDFVRYLTLLSQYKKCDNIKKIAYGYAKKMEKLYEEYIYAVVNNDQLNIFADFPDKFKNGGYDKYLEKLDIYMKSIVSTRKFTSIIETDMYFFGLIYLILFNDKEIDTEKVEELRERISAKIDEFKYDPNHSKNPGALKYLRRRVESSIDVFVEYEK